MARVLIVENDRLVARDLAGIVMSLDHEVVGVAHRFEDAVAMVEEGQPELVLLDIHIDGDRDGVSVAAELREEHSLAIAFLTSHADHETVMRASVVKPNGYLVKPFDEESVDALLNVALSNFSATAHLLDGDRIAAGGQERRTSLSSARKRDTEAFIARNLDRPIKIAELAELCGLSEAEFSRQFQASFSKSPYKFITDERIAEAKRLLRNTDWSIVQIALAVGLSNQSHFTATFRKVAGTTPSAYRRFAQ